MPYRRLPKTDRSRIMALQKAISMEGYKEDGQLVLSYQTIRDAQQLLNQFRNVQSQYEQYNTQFHKTIKTYHDEMRIARMYVSHFIQVLNMAIERGEIKSEVRTEYGLAPESAKVPSLKTDADVAGWGKKIIEGEEARIQHGGIPLYNPNIAKVKVYYSIFADHYFNLCGLRQNAEKYRQTLVQMRPVVDDLLLDLWNQVENFYAGKPLSVWMDRGAKFGLIYYLKTKAKKQIEAEKLQGLLDF